MTIEGTGDESYRRISFWHDSFPGSLAPRPRLEGKHDADVAIIGAGYTGLWTAYALISADPKLEIIVVDSEIAGFGASGRNGGWASALFAAGRATVEKSYGRPAAIALQKAMNGSVDEIGRFCATEGVDAHFHKGGSLIFALNAPQRDRALAEIEEERSLGAGDEDVAWLDAREAGRRVQVRGAFGAVWTPHCARIHPARLVRGLAQVVEERGVKIFERSPAVSYSSGRVGLRRGRIEAGSVLLCTEAYGAGLQDHARAVVPIYTYMVATEPLPPAFWDTVGWAGGECLGDGARGLLYAQRTAYDRIAVGGVKFAYPRGSRTGPDLDRRPDIHKRICRTIVDLWPAAAGARITHAWGGACGVARDWFPSVGFDPNTRIGWAGGYVGDGVATSNLAGRTLADLVLGRGSELTDLPWVGHRSPRWEPEPLRWLGINAGIRSSRLADATERSTGRPAKAFDRLRDLAWG
jgi:glycine/D-amino acid oxidase-like deaminating enzyme